MSSGYRRKVILSNDFYTSRGFYELTDSKRVQGYRGNNFFLAALLFFPHNFSPTFQIGIMICMKSLWKWSLIASSGGLIFHWLSSWTGTAIVLYELISAVVLFTQLRPVQHSIHSLFRILSQRNNVKTMIISNIRSGYSNLDEGSYRLGESWSIHDIHFV